MTLDAATYPALLEENVKLRAERDALAAEIANLRTDAEYNAKFFDEYCAGDEAYTEGRKLTENPHESGTMPHEAWESGWCSSDWSRLTTENDRLRTLEAAAIHWNTHRCVHGVGRLERAIAEAAREATRLSERLATCWRVRRHSSRKER